jgi:hypothetical protein
MEELCRELGDRGKKGLLVGPGIALLNASGRLDIVASVQGNDAKSVEVFISRTLEHSIGVLEALSVSSPRRQRKVLDALCERVEGTLDGVNEALIQQVGPGSQVVPCRFHL